MDREPKLRLTTEIRTNLIVPKPEAIVEIPANATIEEIAEIERLNSGKTVLKASRHDQRTVDALALDNIAINKAAADARHGSSDLSEEELSAKAKRASEDAQAKTITAFYINSTQAYTDEMLTALASSDEELSEEVASSSYRQVFINNHPDLHRSSSPLQFYVNGEKIELSTEDPAETIPGEVFNRINPTRSEIVALAATKQSLVNQIYTLYQQTSFIHEGREYNIMPPKIMDFSLAKHDVDESKEIYLSMRLPSFHLLGNDATALVKTSTGELKSIEPGLMKYLQINFSVETGYDAYIDLNEIPSEIKDMFEIDPSLITTITLGDKEKEVIKLQPFVDTKVDFNLTMPENSAESNLDEYPMVTSYTTNFLSPQFQYSGTKQSIINAEVIEPEIETTIESKIEYKLRVKEGDEVYTLVENGSDTDKNLKIDGEEILKAADGASDPFGKEQAVEDATNLSFTHQPMSFAKDEAQKLNKALSKEGFSLDDKPATEDSIKIMASKSLAARDILRSKKVVKNGEVIKDTDTKPTTSHTTESIIKELELTNKELMAATALQQSVYQAMPTFMQTKLSYMKDGTTKKTKNEDFIMLDQGASPSSTFAKESGKLSLTAEHEVYRILDVQATEATILLANDTLVEGHLTLFDDTKTISRNGKTYLAIIEPWKDSHLTKYSELKSHIDANYVTARNITQDDTTDDSVRYIEVKPLAKYQCHATVDIPEQRSTREVSSNDCIFTLAEINDIKKYYSDTRKNLSEKKVSKNEERKKAKKMLLEHLKDIFKDKDIRVNLAEIESEITAIKKRGIPGLRKSEHNLVLGYLDNKLGNLRHKVTKKEDAGLDFNVELNYVTKICHPAFIYEGPKYAVKESGRRLPRTVEEYHSASAYSADSFDKLADSITDYGPLDEHSLRSSTDISSDADSASFELSRPASPELSASSSRAATKATASSIANTAGAKTRKTTTSRRKPGETPAR